MGRGKGKDGGKQSVCPVKRGNLNSASKVPGKNAHVELPTSFSLVKRTKKSRCLYGISQFL